MTSSAKGKIYCSTGGSGVVNWLMPYGFTVTSDIQEADIVAFAGGADIDHRFYNEPRGRYTNAPQHRDRIEERDFKIAVASGKKMVGVCRGAQLICALSGGQLIQHVENHGGHHGMTTYDSSELRVNSIHHQMLFPYVLPKDHFKVLGWTTRPLSKVYLDGYNKQKWCPEHFKEIEVATFTKTKGFAVQFHPEMLHGSRDEGSIQTNNWLANQFIKFYNDEI